MILFLLLTTYFITTSIKADDYRVIMRDNNRTPLYRGLHYAIRNKNTNRYLENFDETKLWKLFKNLDKNDKRHWLRLYKLRTKGSVCKNEYQGNFCISGSHNHYKLGSTHLGQPLGDLECLKNKVTSNDISWAYWCNNCDIKSDWNCLQWSFEEFKDYRLYARLDNFKFKTPLKEVLKKHMKKVSLMSEQIFENRSPATVSEEVSNTITRSESFEVELSSSTTNSRKNFEKTTIKGEVSFSVFGINLGGGADHETSFEKSFDRSHSNSRKTTTTKSKEYSIKKIITVPPNTSVRVIAYVRWIDDLQMEYEADLNIYGDGPSFENNGRMGYRTIRALLQKDSPHFKLQEIKKDETTVTFRERGSIKASMGLKSYIKVKEIKSNKTLYSMPLTAEDIKEIKT